MSNAEGRNGYVPNPDYSQADWDEVSDNPPISAEEIGKMRPASEVLSPEFLASIERRRRTRGPQKASTKRLISLRVDPDVLERYRSTGPGWQARMNEALRKGAGL